MSAARKVTSICPVRQFFLLESLFHIYRSAIRLFIEYYYRIWSAAPVLCLEILDKIQKRDL